MGKNGDWNTEFLEFNTQRIFLLCIQKKNIKKQKKNCT